jgi:glycosyltransferase involved in cell wall biosynthesis
MQTVPLPATDEQLPRISHEPISMVLPCFNQSAGRASIVDGWVRALRKLDQPFEMIIVDDGSTDGSAETADGIAAREINVSVIRHGERRGYGAAIRTGLAASKHPLFLYSACDYPYSPSDIKKLLQSIDTAHVVSGCRTDALPSTLKSLGALYRGATRVLFGLELAPRPGWQGWPAWWRAVGDRWIYALRMHDVPSAFKLFRRSIFERIPIQSNGCFVHAEILAKANFLGCLMAEVAIGRLGGVFRGVPEPPLPNERADRRHVFHRPLFATADVREPAIADGAKENRGDGFPIAPAE